MYQISNLEFESRGYKIFSKRHPPVKNQSRASKEKKKNHLDDVSCTFNIFTLLKLTYFSTISLF
jgi:hypothetical protein